MKVGYSAIFQGYGSARSDHEIWQTDLALADLAEPLGYDSIWSVEHHFTQYTMTPDVLQFLTYMAARTTRVQLGSMVMVLPWHDPVRAAEQILLLDHMSNGRFILGMGRGTGRVEFDGLRVDMSTARQMFKETAEAIMGALETGVMEYDGEFIHQPRIELRPGPLKTFRGRTYSATVSPESADIMARLGTGVLVVPQKPWHLVQEETEIYRSTYREAIGVDPPPSIMAGYTFVDESADRAEELARTYLGGYWASVIEHYEFAEPHLKTTPGYEFHGLMYDRLTAPGGMEKMTNFYVNLQPWGTPQQVYDKISTFASTVGADHFIGVFNYAGMSAQEAERNMRLFATDVLPELKKLPTPQLAGVQP